MYGFAQTKRAQASRVPRPGCEPAARHHAAAVFSFAIQRSSARS